MLATLAAIALTFDYGWHVLFDKRPLPPIVVLKPPDRSARPPAPRVGTNVRTNVRRSKLFLATTTGIPRANLDYGAADVPILAEDTAAIPGIAESLRNQQQSRARLRHIAQASRFITSLCRDSAGRTWFGCEPDTTDPTDGGVICFDPAAPQDQQWTQYTTADGLGDNYIYAVAADHRGRIWAGHLNHGVSVFDGKTWQNYEVVAGLSKPNSLAGPLGERVFHITVCPTDGDVWICSSCGLARYSDAKDTWAYFTRADGLPSDQPNSIAFDPAGNIVVATQCDGIALADAADNYAHWRTIPGPDVLPTTATGDGLSTNLTNDVLVARDGTIYAATDAGICWSGDKGKTWKFIRGADWSEKVRQRFGGPPEGWIRTTTVELSEDYVTCLAEADDGGLWVGYRSKPCEKVDPKTWHVTDPGVATFASAMISIGDDLVAGTYGERHLMPWRTTETKSVAALPAAFPSAAHVPSETDLTTLIDKTKAGQPITSPIYLEEDWSTSGDAVGRYGLQYACICGGGPPGDHVLGRVVGYKITRAIGPNHTKDDGLRAYISGYSTTDPRALYDPHVQTRRQSEWDDHGEAYHAEFDGPDIWITVQLPSGNHRISLYFFNNDGHTTLSKHRDYLLELRASNEAAGADPAASPVLARGRVCDFWGGVYKSFWVPAAGTYTVRIVRNFSTNAIVSGFFVDQLPLDPAKALPGALPLMGGIRYVVPTYRLSSIGTVSPLLSAAQSLWASGDVSLSDATDFRQIRIDAFRAANTTSAPSPILQNWRWNLRLWVEEDRQLFASAMAAAANGEALKAAKQQLNRNSQNRLPGSRGATTKGS